MFKTFGSILTALLFFTFSATLIGNEWANYYFPRYTRQLSTSRFQNPMLIWGCRKPHD